MTLVFVFGCGAVKSPSEKAARSFMDHYYVATDLNAAQKDADGLALERVKTSLQLTEGQKIDAQTNRPKIRYVLISSEVDGSEANYSFNLTIEPKEVSSIQKKTVLKLRERQAGGWKVTQFSDQDNNH